MNQVFPEFQHDADQVVPTKLTKALIIGLYGIENSGVRHLTAMLRAHGYRADLLFFKDWRHNSVDWPTGKEYEILCDLAKEGGYDVIGLSFGSPYFRVAIEMTKVLRSLPHAPKVLWGGLHTTLTPAMCIEHTDILCVGEGEHPLLHLMDKMEAGQEYLDTPSFWFRLPDGTVKKNPINELMTGGLDGLPYRTFGGDRVYLLDQDELFRGDPQLKHHEFRVFASRGCPYKCAYCYNSSLRNIYPEGRGNYHRRRSVDHVLNEIELALAKMPNVRWIKFDDDTFVFPKPWLEEFCQKYKERIGLPFDCMLTPDVARIDNLRMLKDAGLRGCQMGIEAGSDREQKEVYERTTTVKQILAFDEMNLELKLDVKYDVIIDNPLAWTSDKEALFHLLLDLKSPFKIYLYSLTLYPQSSVTDKVIAAGFATEFDVEGTATKSFRQFRVSVDWARSHEDKFWLALYMIVNKGLPKPLIRKFYESPFFRRHPDLLLEVAQAANLVRMSQIAAEMAWRGELSLQKVREYGDVRKMINQ
jgi:anaerobic magnesium-protoporphyrin IX monomethyl ester cyclase